MPRGRRSHCTRLLMRTRFLQPWLQQWLASNTRGLRRQLDLLQQRAYAAGLTSLRCDAHFLLHLYNIATINICIPSHRAQAPLQMDSQDIWKVVPAAAPLMSLHELLSWQPDTHPFHSLLRATIPLPQVRITHITEPLNFVWGCLSAGWHVLVMLGLTQHEPGEPSSASQVQFCRQKAITTSQTAHACSSAMTFMATTTQTPSHRATGTRTTTG